MSEYQIRLKMFDKTENERLEKRNVYSLPVDIVFQEKVVIGLPIPNVDTIFVEGKTLSEALNNLVTRQDKYVDFSLALNSIIKPTSGRIARFKVYVVAEYEDDEEEEETSG